MECEIMSNRAILVCDISHHAEKDGRYFLSVNLAISICTDSREHLTFAHWDEGSSQGSYNHIIYSVQT